MRRVLILLLLILASCQKPAISSLSINLFQEPTSLDPLFCRNLSSLFLARHLHEGLFRYQNEELENGLCQSYDVNENKTVYTFHLKDAVFHDGSPILAQDFLNSFRRSLEKLSRSDYAHLLYVIKNAQKIKCGLADFSELGVTAISPRCLQFHLEYPDENFLDLLTHPIFFPTKFQNDQLCFSGPFCVQEYALAQHIKLVKNSRYIDAQNVFLESITGHFLNHETAYALFSKNKIHFIGSPLGMLPHEILPSLQAKDLLLKKEWLGICFLRLNTEQNDLKNQHFRYQLSLAIDQNQINQKALAGLHKPVKHFVPRLLLDAGDEISYQPTNMTLDHQQTKRGPLTLKFSASDHRQQNVACLIKMQLEKQLGLKIDLVPRESKMLLQDLIEKKYDLMISSWIADIKNPDNFLNLFLESSQVVNGTQWESDEYQSCLMVARQNHRLCKKSFLEAQEILLREGPIIPLFQFNMLYAKDEKLKDESLNSLGILDFKRAKI